MSLYSARSSFLRWVSASLIAWLFSWQPFLGGGDVADDVGGDDDDDDDVNCGEDDTFGILACPALLSPPVEVWGTVIDTCDDIATGAVDDDAAAAANDDDGGFNAWDATEFCDSRLTICCFLLDDEKVLWFNCWLV